MAGSSTAGAAAPRVWLPLAAWRLVHATLHMLHGLWVIRVEFPRLDEAGRHARIRWWSRGLLRVLGVELRAQGLPRPGASLLVSNHVSWLDIISLHSVVPQARFVSKADVKDWPVVGALVTGAGTLYIERERKRDALRVVHQMAEVMGQGGTVAVFPEGTTGSGQDVLPFHANLLQAAIACEAPVQVAVLRYADPVHPVSPAAEYTGDTTLAQSLWRIARARGLQVNVELLPPQGTAHADRRALAEALREEIAQRLAEAQGLAAQPASDSAAARAA
jgi:1-acyl-sn-glycerol-3-phosphate acyltransferase